MEYINVHSSTIDSAEFQASSDAQQATWLKLIRYLCGQENGDRIKAARAWPDRTWVRTCNVVPRVVKRDCLLWKWEGDDLQVNFYPHKQEATTKALREAGSRGGSVAASRLKAKVVDNGTEANKTEAKLTDISASEVPLEHDLEAFCVAYIDVSRGISGIPETWWRHWYSAQLGKNTFPRDWRRCLIHSFIGDWVARKPNALAGVILRKKNPAAALNGEPPPAPGCAPADISQMV